MAMQVTATKEPLKIQVVCKRCNLRQDYNGQVRCIHCGTQGSLQLIQKTPRVCFEDYCPCKTEGVLNALGKE